MTRRRYIELGLVAALVAAGVAIVVLWPSGVLEVTEPTAVYEPFDDGDALPEPSMLRIRTVDHLPTDCTDGDVIYYTGDDRLYACQSSEMVGVASGD